MITKLSLTFILVLHHLLILFASYNWFISYICTHKARKKNLVSWITQKNFLCLHLYDMMFFKSLVDVCHYIKWYLNEALLINATFPEKTSLGSSGKFKFSVHLIIHNLYTKPNISLHSYIFIAFSQNSHMTKSYHLPLCHS